jgi:hypothetical protein
MTDYQIQANTRRCAATGQELKPGDRYFSVLREADGKLERLDYSAEAWKGPQPGTFSFWSGKIAPQDSRRLPIDDEMLVDCFTRLEGESDPKRVSFRYVIALLLMRRRRFRFEETRKEDGQEILSLRCVRSRQLHEVVNPSLEEAELAAVQDEVLKVLGWQ